MACVFYNMFALFQGSVGWLQADASNGECRFYSALQNNLSPAADKMGSFSISERTENFSAFKNKNPVATGMYSTY